MSYSGRLFADYHQIHLFDDGSTTDLGDAWTDAAMVNRLALDTDASRVPVPAGWLRVRVSRSNLDTAQQADLESDNDPATTEKRYTSMGFRQVKSDPTSAP